MVFLVIMHRCESWTIKKAEHRIDTLELWCWRRLLRVHWTARRSKQSILKEISPANEYSGLFSFRMDCLDLLAVQGTLKSLLISTDYAIKNNAYIFMFQFSSVAQLCLTPWDPMNCSAPCLPVHHQLSEFTQTHVHRVSDAIQSSPSPPAPNPSQHQSLFQWVNSSHQVAKVLAFQLQHQSFQWIFRTDFL